MLIFGNSLSFGITSVYFYSCIQTGIILRKTLCRVTLILSSPVALSTTNYKILSTCFKNKQNGGNLSLNLTLRMKLSNITSAFHEICFIQTFHSSFTVMLLWLVVVIKIEYFCLSSYFCFRFFTHIGPFLIYIPVKLLCKQWESEIQNKFSI